MHPHQEIRWVMCLSPHRSTPHLHPSLGWGWSIWITQHAPLPFASCLGLPIDRSSRRLKGWWDGVRNTFPQLPPFWGARGWLPPSTYNHSSYEVICSTASLSSTCLQLPLDPFRYRNGHSSHCQWLQSTTLSLVVFLYVANALVPSWSSFKIPNLRVSSIPAATLIQEIK